jgi:hypothetical protein
MNLKRLNMKRIIYILFIVAIFQTMALRAKNSFNDSLKSFVYSNIPDTYPGNIVVVAMNINACYSCNSPKVNTMLKNLGKLISDCKSMIVIESNISKDAFSLKNRYQCDFFVEDTNMIFLRNKSDFPNIFIIDKNKNIFKFNFFKILKYGANIEELVNAEKYDSRNEVTVNEGENYYFSEPIKPILIKNNLLFLARRRNQILTYNIIKKEFSIFFSPQKKFLSEFSNIKENDIDFLESMNFFDINFLFDLVSIDYDLNQGKMYVLIELLSNIEKNNNNITISKRRGILSIDKFNNKKFNKFQIKDFVEFSDINCFDNLKLLTVNENWEDTNDSSACVIRVKDHNKFDTIIHIADLKIVNDNSVIIYKPKILRLGNNKRLYIDAYSQSGDVRIFSGNNKIEKSFQPTGVFKYFNGFIINDMTVINNNIFIIALFNNSRILIQKYNLSGNLDFEYIYSTNNIILSSIFIKNNNNQIILLNKWKYKRWSLDYIKSEK